MPEPTIPPMTSMVASNSPSCRASRGLEAEARSALAESLTVRYAFATLLSVLSSALFTGSLLGVVSIHDAILHDEPDAFERGNILQRIAVDRDHIGIKARLKLADRVLLAQ